MLSLHSQTQGKQMKKELIIFFGLLVFLAIGMHFEEWMSHPIDHLMGLPKSGAFGLGAFHPFVFTLFFYLIILLFRAVVKAFTK